MATTIKGATLTARLLDNASAAPERTAITLLQPRQPDQSLSYRRLLQGAAGYARAYQSAGVQPGEVVVLILQHGEALVCAFWGALLAGAAPSMMPFLTEKLAPEKYRQELAALVSITRPAALVTYPAFGPEVHAALDTGGGPNSVRAVIISDAVAIEAEPELSALPGLAQTPD